MAAKEALYDNGWHLEADRHLIRVMFNMRSGSPEYNLKTVTNPSPPFLQFICSRVNDAYGSNFPGSTCLDQMRRLHIRYIVFGYIIGRDGVSWKRNQNNVLDVADNLWSDIIAVHPFAEVYRGEGKDELLWHELRVIFDEKKVEKKALK